MCEGEPDIYSATASRLWSLSTKYLNHELEDSGSFLEELARLEVLPLLNELKDKTIKELRPEQIRFAQMLHFAKLTRDDPSRAIVFARSLGLVK